MSAPKVSAASAAALAAGGIFSQALPDFNPRESQQALAENVGNTIDSGGVLVAESGTGTGKTFAYLVPAILSGRQIVISTGTRHLQDQLFYRDLPVVRKALAVSPDVALLKGRSNYLCIYRLKQLGQDSALRYQKDTLKKRTILENWAATTPYGEIADVSELDEQDPIWRQVTSTSDNCLGSECPDFKACYVNKARQRAMKAQLVVVNHHLFFSDVSLKEEGFGELLPDYDVVIFDEAHQIPDVATRFFGFTVSTFQLNELARDVLVTEAKEKSGVPLQDCVSNVQACIAPLHLAVSKHQRGSSTLIVEDPACLSSINNLLDALADLETLLSNAANAGDGLQRCHERTLQTQGYLLSWLEHSARAGEMVCWFETTRANTRLTASPLSVAEQMRKILAQPEKSAILTSATLAAGKDFSFYLQNLGLDEVATAHYDSPFDYANNALLYLPQSLPEPQDRRFVEAMVDASLPVLTASKGRAFMLFTSYAMLHRAAALMQNHPQWTLFIQGEAPRGELIEQFRKTDDAVLLGTASFWEGVDIQGEDLSCVIIDKLPFAPPNDPVLSARLKKVEQAGGKPFFDVQIPAAVISLKQGAGRLIRDENDKGVLMICDARLRTKGYGTKFVQALPPMRQTAELSDVTRFFSRIQS
ncbi:MAG: ATP-dependent DNA helicase [Arenicellales bacterium]